VTAAPARRLVLAAAEPTAPGMDRLERVRALLRPEFLAEVWQADGQVFAPPRDHPLLGLRKCAVIDCEAGVRTPNTDLCKLCVEKFKASGLPMAQFTAIPANKISKGEQLCRVPGCPRPSHLRVRFCGVHYAQWRQAGLSPEDFAASPAARPLPSFGECLVVSCSRAASGSGGLCYRHRARWNAVLRQDRAPDVRRWLRIAEPVNADHFVIFKGLAEQVQLELLADIRALGLTRPGGLAAGLPDERRDLPAWVLQILDTNLHVLEQRSGTGMRRMTELMMDTGRRPDEICQLRLDCLTRDGHGKPVLIYTDSKNHRPNRRLPIAEATARIITSQQADVCARFPGTPARDLPLFPRDTTNPDGTAAHSEQAFTNAHRQWVNSIAHLLVTTVTGADGKQHEQVFDRLAVIPYAYRHSYAQRHADEGVSPDVLRDLLGHDKIGTTLGYYRNSRELRDCKNNGVTSGTRRTDGSSGKEHQ